MPVTVRPTLRKVDQLELEVVELRAELSRLASTFAVALEAERASSEALWRALLGHAADDTRHTGKAPK